jgi:hypothetical protein
MTDGATGARGIQPSKLVRNRGRLERGWRKHQLLRQLAEGEETQDNLAALHGVVQASISEFAQRHKEEILAIRKNMQDEFVSLWVAQKINRLSEYQDDIEAINELLELGDSDDDKLRTAKHRALRAAAEELGQLPNRMSVKTEGAALVRHVLEGVDTDELA